MKKDFIPERTLLIDNQSYSFFLQPENGYLIEHFQPGEETDYQDMSVQIDNFEDDDLLLSACEFFTKQLIHEADVRVELAKKFTNRENHKKKFRFDLEEFQKTKKNESNMCYDGKLRILK